MKFTPEYRKQYDAERWQKNKELRREQKRDQRRRVKEEVDSYKRSNPCGDCHQHFHPVQMQFDHLPGSEKEHVVSDLMRTGQRNKLWREIEKCELVCANCYALRTWLRYEATV